MKEYFREIYDIQDIHDNLATKTKIYRIIIRYLVRVFGLSISEVLISFIYKIQPLKKNSYIKYILKINLFRISYLKNLSNLDYKSANIIKKEWADFVSKKSASEEDKSGALHYLAVINKDENIKLPLNESIIEPRKFYIYGPSATNTPNPKYSDYTLIHTKPYPKILESFNKELLFLNSYYFMFAVDNNFKVQKELKARYKKIYVTTMQEHLPEGFNVIDLHKSGYIQSEMALQRILRFLIKEYKVFDCVIEGFNFYLEKDAYKNKNYHKLTRKDNNLINEKEICLSLADHDFLFNFKLTKNLVKRFNLIDSNDFREILSLTDDHYLEKLFISRDFSSLKKI